MKLFLIRHGKAEDGYPDETRRLTQEGTEIISNFFAWIMKHVPFDGKTIYHSGLIRAEQTADILSRSMPKPPPLEMINDLEPMADPQKWLPRLSMNQDDLVLVGHNPHLTRLISLLIQGEDHLPIVNMKKGMIVCLQRDEYSHWTLQWALSPKNIASKSGKNS